MLFRGTLGMGMVEIKCNRCNHISMFHSIEVILRNKPRTYIIVYNSEGRIIIGSESVQKFLGYNTNELHALSIQDISPKNQLYKTSKRSSSQALEDWEQYHAHLPSDIVHKAKSGTIIDVTAKFFPMASYEDFYTVGLYTVVD